MASINFLKNIFSLLEKNKFKLSGILFWIIFILLVLFFILIIFIVFIKIYTSIPSSTLFKKEIFFAVKLSFLTALISALIAVIISIPVAFVLSRYDFIFKNLIEILLYLPVVLPPVAIGAMLLLFLEHLLENFLKKIFFMWYMKFPD